MLPRCDAAPRPYWLRDWQTDFEGFAKVHEHRTKYEMKRIYSVAYVVKARVEKETACLCFPLLLRNHRPHILIYRTRLGA